MIFKLSESAARSQGTLGDNGFLRHAEPSLPCSDQQGMRLEFQPVQVQGSYVPITVENMGNTQVQLSNAQGIPTANQ